MVILTYLEQMAKGSHLTLTYLEEVVKEFNLKIVKMNRKAHNLDPVIRLNVKEIKEKER